MITYTKRITNLMKMYGFTFTDYGKTILYNGKCFSTGEETKLKAINSALEKYFRGNKFHYVYRNKNRTLIDYERMLLLGINKGR